MASPNTARPGSIALPEVDFSDVVFLTVPEVAGVMRVSKMTVYRMVHSGELTAVRVGRSFRVPAQVVREYFKTAEYCVPDQS